MMVNGFMVDIFWELVETVSCFAVEIGFWFCGSFNRINDFRMCHRETSPEPVLPCCMSQVLWQRVIRRLHVLKMAPVDWCGVPAELLELGVLGSWGSWAGERFYKYDADKDGFWSKPEFCVTTSGGEQSRPKMCQQWFSFTDQTGTGYCWVLWSNISNSRLQDVVGVETFDPTSW